MENPPYSAHHSETIFGLIERVTFCSDESGFTIAGKGLWCKGSKIPILRLQTKSYIERSCHRLQGKDAWGRPYRLAVTAGFDNSRSDLKHRGSDRYADRTLLLGCVTKNQLVASEPDAVYTKGMAW